MAGLFVGVDAFCEAVRNGIPGIVIRSVLVRSVLKPVIRLGIDYWIPEKFLGGHDRPEPTEADARGRPACRSDINLAPGPLR